MQSYYESNRDNMRLPLTWYDRRNNCLPHFHAGIELVYVLEGGFDAIVLNPPIRTGKAVIYAMFADAAAHLSPGGALYIVIRKQQGAESAQKYLGTIYADVERIAREKGYWVLRCAKPEAGHEEV